MGVWTKKLGNNEHALFVFNRHSSRLNNVAVSLSQLDMNTNCAVRDIWARKDRAPVKGTWHSGPLGAYDSVFIRLKSIAAPDFAASINSGHGGARANVEFV